MNVLIVDGDKNVRRVVRTQLEGHGISIDAVATVAEAIRALDTARYDLLILDLMLPGDVEVETLAALRRRSPAAHVIAVSGVAAETERVKALQLGADDYVVKPFFPRELAERVLAVRRRLEAGSATTLTFDEMEISLVSRRVTSYGLPVTLTAKEFDLLAFLAGRPGQVFDRDELLHSVWQSTPDWQQAATVTEHIRRLRAKLEIDPTNPRFLLTVRGAGYRFDARRAVPFRSSRSPREQPDIRHGLDRREFDVYYQPIVDLDDHRVVTVEALMRWEHPTRGLLSPAGFIGTGGDTGLLVELGDIVLRRACRRVAGWRSGGADVELAVNLSRPELESPGLTDRVIRTLQEFDLTPHALWFDISEAALVEDVELASRVLQGLADLGIRIAVDDFGTGWASLTYLRASPVHALKIDASFVQGADRNRNDAAIAQSIISLGAELGLAVIAEGIETVGQEAALRSLGCPLGQGYRLGGPAPGGQSAPVCRSPRLSHHDLHPLLTTVSGGTGPLHR